LTKAEKPKPLTSKAFYLEDQAKTLFPLETNKILVAEGSDKIEEFWQSLIANNKSFLPQTQVHASKDSLHLRRTVKLDPVADYFIYDLIYRNRASFKKNHMPMKKHFGYRFQDGKPEAASFSYASFKSHIDAAIKQHDHFISFDVATYFNSVYHHDLQAWFAGIGAKQPDVEAFGKFFREINAGRSLDCLPHGIYPTKMIGNDFLRFLEESAQLKSSKIARFMDDVYMFDDDSDVLKQDFEVAQRILGLKGLSVNSSKTKQGGRPVTQSVSEGIDDLKKSLLSQRRSTLLARYDANDDLIVEEIPRPLDRKEVKYLIDLLSNGNLNEEDAELITVVMRNNVDQIVPHLEIIARNFPHLAKSFCNLCAAASDKEAIAALIIKLSDGSHHLSEYQLFWFAVMLERYLLDTKAASKVICALLSHPQASEISKAKILEISDNRYGLREIREQYLRSGTSNWLSWSSAVGARNTNKSVRNYQLSYFKNGSSMNKLIAEILEAGD
jgi:hypothetical protein